MIGFDIIVDLARYPLKSCTNFFEAYDQFFLRAGAWEINQSFLNLSRCLIVSRHSIVNEL